MEAITPIEPRYNDSEKVLLLKMALALAGASEGTAPLATTTGGGAVSQGGLFEPTGSTNGTALANRPIKTSGARFYLASGASVTFYIADKDFTPSGAPADTVTLGPFEAAAILDEPTSGDDSIFLTNVTGSVLCRWVQR